MTNPTDVLRTPDHCFNQLANFDFAPHYIDCNDDRYGALRMHYLDEGTNQKNTPTVLMLHGEPTWCYLYRNVIPPLAAAGLRCIAPDHIGFGRSDKLTNRADYSYQQYVDYLVDFIQQLELNNIILLCQDWGGPIGLRALSIMPERFSAVVATNTLLPNCEPTPNGIDHWPGELIENWAAMTKQADDLPVAEIVNGVCCTPLTDAVKAAYDAPFPDASYKAAVLEFPSLIPIREQMAGCAENRAAWKVLEQWQKPFVTAFSDSDPSTKAWEAVFQQRIPGARHHYHTEIKQAGHFVQEEQGPALAQVVIELTERL
ncbi:haloalkane dehalogenase [Oceanicoccus sp. KOV_DT_Chl]|uniref:haloalkane dehalogenase n=1 Tax=Oceanicoccus sp. KOV_DT_Chl TaxID=1904639 RepID=UPI000C7B3733|nr:haloalkane dehalogenase [Oceanicoccus sp. KOV_DT_Chl]